MNEILQPLRMYDTLAYALYKRNEALRFNNIVPLIASSTSLLPFTFSCVKNNATPNNITTCEAINHRTGKVHDILSYMTFKFGLDDMDNPSRFYGIYTGSSIISPLPQGIYRLHLASSDDEWFSDIFKVGHFRYTTSIEFHNDTSFAHTWMTVPILALYKATYETFTFDSFEFDEFDEVYKDKDNRDLYSYRRIDKIRSLVIFGDSNAFDCLKMAQLCDMVYITDEVGQRKLARIHDVIPTGIDKSNYAEIIVKYSFDADSIITVTETPVSNFFSQVGTNYVAEDDSIEFNNEDIKFGGNSIKFG